MKTLILKNNFQMNMTMLPRFPLLGICRSSQTWTRTGRWNHCRWISSRWRREYLWRYNWFFRLCIRLSTGFNSNSGSGSSGNRVPLRSCFCTGRKQYPDSCFQCGSSWYIPCPEGDQVSPVYHRTVPWQDTDAYGCRDNYLFLWYAAYVCWFDWISDWILCRERT